jgi:hypothetical protein
MTKVTITIEDMADRKACVIAIRQLFAALEGHHGEREANHIWDSNQDHLMPKWQARKKLDHALRGLEYSDQRLIFEYYGMAKPSKEGLARDLAAKNVSLHEEWHDWLAAWRKWWAQHGAEARRRQEIIELARGTEQWPPNLPRLPDFPQRPAALFGPRGATDWRTMHQKIKRVFRAYPDACAGVNEAPIETREETRSRVEERCRIDGESRMLGGRILKRRRGRPAGTKRKR